MELTIRDLAFLEYEMKQIKEDHDRDGEDRQQAASLLGRIGEEIEQEKESKRDVFPKANAGP